MPANSSTKNPTSSKANPPDSSSHHPSSHPNPNLLSPNNLTRSPAKRRKIKISPNDKKIINTTNLGR